MLDELAVANLGIIEHARLEPGQGFCVVSGETGAGKTLLLGALRLLAGEGGRSDLVGPFGDEAKVEGRFVGEQGEVAVAKRIPRQGRTRSYRDGSMVSAGAVEAEVASAVELIGQHDQLTITRPVEVRKLVDRRLDKKGNKVLAQYRSAYLDWSRLIEDQERFGGDRRALERELDLVTYQAAEIANARLQPGDDVELGGLLRRLRHADELKTRFSSSLEATDNGRDQIGMAIDELRRAARLEPGFAGLVEDAERATAELEELSRRLRTEADGLVVDPAAVGEAENRLAAMTDLRRKYGATLEDVLAFGKETAARRVDLEEILSRTAGLDVALVEARTVLEQAGAALLAARRAAGLRLTVAAIKHLNELGFSQPALEVNIESAEPSAGGADRMALCFASDRRLALGEVSKVASGGELSRLVLSLRLAGGGASATLVFDEIDAGVGGATALAMGRKLAALAGERQVLCVTHLPQIAAFADRHYAVRRSGNTATLELVVGESRIEELSRMLAGLPESERGRQAAAELLHLAAGS